MFFPFEEEKIEIERYAPRMMCLEDDIELFGNWDTFDAKRLSIHVQGCDYINKPDECGTEE